MKVSLNENQTTLNEISLLISISSQIVMKSLSLFKQTSSRLDFIKEENMFNTAMLSSLNVFKLVQTDQSAEASHQVSDLSEVTEVTDHEDSFFSDHLSLSEAQGLLVDAQTQMLDPGLATLSFQHLFIKQHSNSQMKAQYASSDVNEVADLILIDSVT